jgi:hypothetical protein
MVAQDDPLGWSSPPQQKRLQWQDGGRLPEVKVSHIWLEWLRIRCGGAGASSRHKLPALHVLQMDYPSQLT